jgi:hypothetical protein
MGTKLLRPALRTYARVLYKDKAVMSFLFEDLHQSDLEAKHHDPSKFQGASICQS